MHERPERIASQPAKRILQRHGQVDVPHVTRIGKSESSLGMFQRCVEETLVERMAADDAIEGHHGRDWKLGGEVEEVTFHELSRV